MEAARVSKIIVIYWSKLPPRLPPATNFSRFPATCLVSSTFCLAPNLIFQVDLDIEVPDSRKAFSVLAVGTYEQRREVKSSQSPSSHVHYPSAFLDRDTRLPAFIRSARTRLPWEEISEFFGPAGGSPCLVAVTVSDIPDELASRFQDAIDSPLPRLVLHLPCLRQCPSPLRAFRSRPPDAILVSVAYELPLLFNRVSS